MAADGAWTQASGPTQGPTDGDDALADRALTDLRALVGQMEGWLESLEATPIKAAAAAELSRSVEELGRRIGDAEGAEALSDLAAKLAAVAERAVRQTEAASRLTAASVAAEPPRPGRPAVLWLATGAVAVLIAGAGLLMAPNPGTQPPAVLAQVEPAPALRARVNRPKTIDIPAIPATGAVANLIPLGPPPAPTEKPASPRPDGDLAPLLQALQRGDAKAIPKLAALAQKGVPGAQLQLAQLYEGGAPGIPRDLPTARDWTRRAAEAGDRVAMHNLALFMMGGEGGPRDQPQALRWFRKAAQLGVVDSQHNLGLIYESGLGVEKNLREAFRWYSVAANAGDLPSRERVVAIEAQLGGRERTAVEREAAAFRPGDAPPPAAAQVIAPATTVAETQQLLSRGGYFIGPADGSPSPAYAAAIQAYRRDHPAVAQP